MSKTIDYGEKEYWDNRYVTETRDHFDWYYGYNNLKRFLNKFYKRSDKVLMVGCGNSKLGEDMNTDGYGDIVNIDFSEPLIEDMKLRTKDRQGLEYLTMDGRQMDFLDETFESIFDKGTVDAVMCSDDDNSNALKIVEEVYRVLKPGGVFIIMSYGSPEARLPLVNRKDKFNWSYEMRMGGKTSNVNANECHYIYIMRKVDPNQPTLTKPENAEVFLNYLNSSIGKVPLEVLSE
ncbi:hypothetical protein DLAC_03817 [Tieghemostelium lacteum]|uniref:Methyltransferase type 11 domain-containing protein n=1 Tax=Tieghemostelium lacteum TaxID=361077 RepID=A0A152A0W3_TIELA|nr:hypothetical protein DLAC_03817 [Tieghemostelium lacteum]|eukprot:KYQ99865.1 hypothetical protein DLAC_03817 [Tieghemostelium lacteum]